MKKFRTGHDAPVRPPLAKPGKPGEALPPSRIRVIDQDGNRHGHISRSTGNESTAARLGIRNAKLTKIKGETVWQGESGAFHRRRQELKRRSQLATAKGSVTRTPTAPETCARPKR